VRFFYKTSGAISVFLSLILLSVTIMGVMTVDAARIYMSKVAVSDAGDMAMNAGLAQYNEELHDKYGLLVMDESPEAMSGELEEFFTASLNGGGLSGDGEEYARILDLLTKNFEAINVAGSEIYRTEAEKQQIIEYMKYRAPVCLTELVVEKIGELKNTQKKMDAMNAQMDFTLAMQDCQDEFEEAKKALDTLNQAIESFPSDQTIKNERNNTKKDFQETVSRCLLMREMIQNYDERSQSTDLEAMVSSYINAAKKVNLSPPCSSVAFNSYIDAMYYENTVSHLGGANKLLNDYDKEKEEEEALLDETESSASGMVQEETADKEREELQKLVNDYNSQKNRISGYANTLLSTAKNMVDQHHNTLNGYYNTAKTAESAAKTAVSKLKKVKKKLEDAKEKFDLWDTANNELKAVDDSGNMDTEVEEYRKFFSTGDGASDLQQLEKLMEDVQADQAYFSEWKNALEEEKFFKKSIVTTDTTGQMNKYIAEAKSAVSSVRADYSSVENVRGTYAANYSQEEFSGGSKKSIKDNAFYKKLEEYCKEENGNGSPKDQNDAKDKLNQSQNAAENVSALDNSLPTYDWGSAQVTLPSTLVGDAASKAGEALTDLNTDGNVNSSSARSNIISKFKNSMQEASSFLDGVDRIVADSLENLYVAEYAMQMFSYYTVDREDGQSRPPKEIISLSGYNFQERAAYKGECEYILWGDSASQTNVRNTFMLIFGIRLLFNSFYAFTDTAIDGIATASATAIAVAAPYLVPILKVVIKLGIAGVETANDIQKLQQGYGVTIVKDSSTWVTLNEARGDNTKGLTFDYSEYLRVFLNVSLLGGNETGILGRIADCIQVDEPEIDLRTSYTMLAVQAQVGSRTTFMRKISDLGEGGSWGFPDDTYTIFYQSILGY
jgi:hypothetical protein